MREEKWGRRKKSQQKDEKSVGGREEMKFLMFLLLDPSPSLFPQESTKA